MSAGHVGPFARRSFGYRWRWLIGLAALTAVALVAPFLAALGPQVVVYPTTDFARLPISVTAPPTPAEPESCVSVQQADAAAELVERPCGSPASTFRVIGRVSDASQCVSDADLTYSWSSGQDSGAVCLDYDWAAGQCLQITSDVASKVNCAEEGAVRPEMAIIGAVDVSYCREGGIEHPARQFTVCTLAGDKDCSGETHGT